MRNRFPIFTHQPDLVYLDSAATTHKPKEVVDAISRFYSEHYATVHRAVYRGAAIASDLYHQSREAVRAFINAQSVDEIVFTQGTTEALNLVAFSWGRSILRPGDEIVLTEMEHHSNLVPWQMLAEQTGAVLRFAPMTLEGSADPSTLICAKTKIVAVAHVSNVTGTVQPIRRIASDAHRVGAVLVVDGAQAAPHMLVDVQALDCDFYAFSGHKCYGPTGVGVLYGKKALLNVMPPLEGGGDMISHVGLDRTSYAMPPLRFEAGTPSIASVIGLKPALDFIESIGRDSIAAAEGALYRLLVEGLANVEGVRILGTCPGKAPLATLSIPGVHPLDLATMLDLKNIAVRSGHLCAQPALRAFGLQAALRISFGIYNTQRDVELFLHGLKDSLRALRG